MWLFGRKTKESDEALASAYRRSGDLAVLGDLFDRHVRTIYGVCLFYYRDKVLAEEGVMELFEKLSAELKKREVQNFRGWLSFVVRNHCISALRKKKSQRLLPEEYLAFEVTDATEEEEQRIAKVTEDRLLQHLTESLPLLNEKQRLCVSLFYLEGLSYQQTAERTGYSIGEVKSYIQNAKRNLKLLIEKKEREKQS